MAALDLYYVTFNCARNLLEVDTFSSHLFGGLPSKHGLPDLIVLSLQELAPIAHSFLGGSFLVPYLDRFQAAIRLAVNKHASDGTRYFNVVTRNAGMTAIMVFARSDLLDNTTVTHSAGVGVGLWDMGNKGAVGVRLAFDPPEEGAQVDLTFVAAHLAPFEENVNHRNKDWENIVRGLAFAPSSVSSSKLRTPVDEPETEPLISPSPSADSSGKTIATSLFTAGGLILFGGDLNYRSQDTAPEPQGHVHWPQPTDDVDSPSHYSNLFKDEQLSRERAASKTLHGLTEAPIDFPPTYKYDLKASFSSDPKVKAGVGDTEEEAPWQWSKHRVPSWCDRILFAPDQAVEVLKYTCLPLTRTSDHRPVTLSAKIKIDALGRQGAGAVQAPFPLRPDWAQRRMAARRREFVVGVLAWFAMTWEGRSALIATVLGGFGGWLVIRSFLTTE